MRKTAKQLVEATLNKYSKPERSTFQLTAQKYYSIFDQKRYSYERFFIGRGKFGVNFKVSCHWTGFQRYEVFSYHFSLSHFSSCYRNVRRLCSPGLHEGKSNTKMFYSNNFYCKVESKTYHECLWNIMKPSYRNNQMRLKCIITY